MLFTDEIIDLTEMLLHRDSAEVQVEDEVGEVIQVVVLVREAEVVAGEDHVVTINLPAEAEPSLSCRNKTLRIWATRSGKLHPRVVMS